MRLTSALALGTLAVGCGPDFTNPWEVKDPRVLAVRIEVDGDPNNARPTLRDPFSMRLVMATPRKPETADPTKRYDAKLDLCIGVKLPNGELACLEFNGVSTIPISNPEVVSDDEIRFNGLGVPPSIVDLLEMLPMGEGVEIDRFAAFGAVCVDGKVERVEDESGDAEPAEASGEPGVKTVDPTELYRCVDNDDASYEDPLVFSVSVLLDVGQLGAKNQSPSFACEADEDAKDACVAGVKVDGEDVVPGEVVLVRPRPDKAPDSTKRKQELWKPRPVVDGKPAPLPWEGCADDDFWGPTVKVGDDEHTIRVRFDAKDREKYMAEVMVQNETRKETLREELLVSHAITDLGGELARYFSVIENDVPAAEAELEVAYTPPSKKDAKSDPVPQDGRLVRVYFVVRDERGGVDYTSRELCLVPADAE